MRRAKACPINNYPRLALFVLVMGLFAASGEASSLWPQKAPVLRGLYIHSGGGYRNLAGEYHRYLRPGFAGSVAAGYYPSWGHWAGFVPALRGGLSVGSYGYRFNEHSSLFFTSFAIIPSMSLPLSWGLAPYAGMGAVASYYHLNLDSSGQKAHVFQPGWRAQGGVQWFFHQDWGLDLGAFYGATYGEGPALPSYGVYGAVFTSYESFRRMAIGRTPYLKLGQKKLPPVFAAHAAYYNEKGLGELQLTNVSHKRLKEVRIESGGGPRFGSKSSRGRVSLASSGQARLSLPVNLKRRVMQLTEPLATTLSLRLVYQVGGERVSQKESLAVKIYPKNFIVWDDYRKIGSFVTPRDEVVSTYARRAVAEWGGNVRRLPSKVGRAMVLLNTLAASGLGYSEDPDNGILHIGREQRPMDYLMLPRQTLQKRAGDCDDLVVLYASLLESVGVETEVAVVPGHVFLLINSGVLPWNHTMIHPQRSHTISRKGSLWLPIEVTSLTHGFVAAWQKGVHQLKRYHKAQLRLVHVRTAWQHYSPMDLGQGSLVALPDKGRFARLWRRDWQSYVEHTYDKPLARLRARLRAQPGKKQRVLLWNRMALLYAGMGEYTKGLALINQALEEGGADKKVAAKLWLNKGNFHHALDHRQKAFKSYDKALALDQNCHAALIGKALWYYEEGRQGKAKDYYQRARGQRKGYAQAYPFLSRQKTLASDSTQANRRWLWLALD